ncbi:muscle M-line assembly protein unc-89-like isoform X2 [Gambusia affinis]|uniref:muscle M-line assembly protein unc-89-like isoform X2 n=1 Tax=Gambusia affinis TaxID=33528 RepID=UPI001CDD110B|nr:muscle M-line assembly protein unc-89-like isoform X2 [Gambusia affinis]
MRTMKKMASLLSVCVFLLCCSAAVASRGCDQLVAVGEDVDVPLGYEPKPTDALRWKFNGNIIFYKKRGRIIQGKNDDINDDGSLKLTNLKLDQEGLYTSEVFDGNGRQTSSKSTNLCVLDPVKKPTLNITCLTSEVVFTCSHDPQPDGTKHYDTIHYKWLQNGNLISNATEISMTRKVAETENLLVSCEVGNEVSSATSDSLTHTCIGCDQLVAVGGDVDVPLGYELKPTDVLRWNFNGNIIFFKKRGRIIQGKNDDINDDGSLKLTNLKLDQEGLYTSEVFDQDGRKTSSKSTNLCVLDPVKKPTLNITCLTSEVVFTCSHDPQPDGTKHYDTIHYKWLQNGNLISNATEISMTRKVAETENLLVSCEVGNQVSSATSDSLTHTCIACDQLVAVGGDVDVPLGYELKPTDALRWKFNGNIIFNKKRGKLIQGKNDDINDDGSLKLTNLKLDQEGLYTSEVFSQDGRQTSSKSANLCVLDPVKKPTLNITCLTSEVVFTCSHDPQPDGTKHYDTIHYKWLQNGNLISNATEISMTRKVAETENLLVSCEVGNEVSSATSDSLTHTCIGCDKYAATGRSFNVPLGYKLKSTDTLKWRFNETVIYYKRPSRVVSGEATDITEDGSLKLTNLKKDQEGVYTAEIFDSNGKLLKTVKTHLCIKDPVKKPAVEAECKEEENKVIFKCVTDKTPKSEIKKYQWLRNNVQMDKTVQTFMLTAAETKDIKFACNISNDVSFEISEPVTHNCAEIGFPENRCGIRLWDFNGYNVVVLLLLAIAATVCCI